MKRPKQTLMLAGVLAVLLSGSAWAKGGESQARPCPVPRGADSRLSSVDSAERLSFIQASLNRDAARASTWTWMWFGLNAALLAAQVPMIWLGDRVFGVGAGEVSSRPNFVAGVITSAVGLGLLVALPVSVRWAPSTYVQRAAEPGAEPCSVLAEAEQRLFDDAQNEAFGVKWYWHAANVALNAAVLLVLGFGYHDWLFGTISAVSTLAFSTVQMLTQPTQLVADAEAYRSGRVGQVARPPLITWAPMISPQGGGVAMRLQF